MNDPKYRPLLVIFGGPNGSGKSTITTLFQERADFSFPERYINPDEIALSLGGNTVEKAYEASAIAARQRLECIEQKQSFAFETVMSHPSKLAILETAREAGFETQLIFVATNNPLTNVERVKQRVLDGGHDVPENKIISRYHRSLSFLPKASEITDRTYIFDNSDTPSLEATLSQGNIISKSEQPVKWVRQFFSTLEERNQENLIIARQEESNIQYASLAQGSYSGEIKSIGQHFLTQETQNNQTIIHENTILRLEKFTIGHDVSIQYQNGTSKIAIPKRELNVSRAIDDILFELANSAKYVALNYGLNNSNAEERVHNFPSGVTIEKKVDSLLVNYNNKTITFNRDLKIVNNSFSEKEIEQLYQHLQTIKQLVQERDRDKQIQHENDLSR